MKIATTFLTLACLLAISAMAPIPASAGDIPLLFPAQDEKSVEIQIADYLEGKGMNVTRLVPKKNADDVYLKLRFGKDGTDDYDIKAYIDTMPSAHNKKTRAIEERKIQIRVYPQYSGVKGITRTREFLEFLNNWSLRYWAPQRVYLDRDNDLILAWDINIPGNSSPVHCEQVRDALLRINSSWLDMFDELKANGLI